MNELYPSDSVLNALSGTQGSIGVPPRTTAEAPHYTNVQKLRDWLNHVLAILNACRICHDSTDGDLQFSVYAGNVVIGGAIVNFAEDLNNNLTNNDTNYIYIDAAGVLQVNVTGYPAIGEAHFRCGRIAASAGTWNVRTGLTDDRDASLFASPGPAGLVTHYGEVAHEAGYFDSGGDAQVSRYVARVATTDQDFHEMFLDGIDDRLTLDDEKLYGVTVTIAARMDTGGAECAVFKRMLTVERTGGTVTLQNAAQTIGTDINPGSDYNVQLTADDTNKALKIEVKHDDAVGSKNVRWGRSH